MDFEIQQSTLLVSDRSMTLFFNYAFIKRPTEYELETDSEYFALDSDAAPIKSKYSGKAVVVAYDEARYSVKTELSKFSLSEDRSGDQTILHK